MIDQKVIPIILCVSVFTIFAGSICAAEIQTEIRNRRIQFIEKCTGKVVVCGREDAEHFGVLLQAAGFSVEVLTDSDISQAGASKADMIVFTPSCSGLKQVDFRKFKGKKILAMGDTGAIFLGTGRLLIGYPHVWHDMRLPKIIHIPLSLKNTDFRNILHEPCPIKVELDEEWNPKVTLHDGEGELTHVGIYDGGAFPTGTLGIGRESGGDLHHWVIAKQANYILWGVNSSFDNLTDDGLRFFVNLCYSFINAAREPVVIPAKRFLERGGYYATLVGGHRDVYYLTPENEGLLEVRLEWRKPIKMYLQHMMMGDSRSSVGGRSPLTIHHRVVKTRVGKEFEITIGSHELPEGKECPYTVEIAEYAKQALSQILFGDPGLEAAVSRAIGKSGEPILKSDMTDLEGLTELSAILPGGRQITNLSGIEHCTRLQKLDLSSNNLSDLSPLSSLTNLQELHLENNYGLSDISPLSSLTNLRTLVLYHSPLSDITHLSGLTNLQELHLHSNKIIDIPPLSGLTNLQVLELAANQISDITHLSGLTNLPRLFLSNNQISDISPLSSLTNLQELHLAINRISDISPLSGLTNLQLLHLTINQISDISPLSGLTNLQNLALGSNQISDISPLSGLTNLQLLHLDSNQISDISPLVSNSGIGKGDEVNLRGNPLDDEAHDVHIPALQKRGVKILFNPKPSGEIVTFSDKNLEAAVRDALVITERPIYESDLPGELTHLGASKITYLSGIERCTDLGSLFLPNNQISDITPLSSLTNLWRLHLENNEISDISPLSSLANLQGLFLENNQISDISPLANLTNLRVLSLRDNKIQDISSLAALTNIGEKWKWGGQRLHEGSRVSLELSDNQISDVSALVSNSGIGEGDAVALEGNPLNHEAYDVHIPALIERGVKVAFDPKPEE